MGEWLDRIEYRNQVALANYGNDYGPVQGPADDEAE